MAKGARLNLVFASDYLNAAMIVSLLSVLVLVGLFHYLNRYTGRRYFSTWTLGWIFYAGWLGFGLWEQGGNPGPMHIMLRHWCIGVSAALLFWGSSQFLKLPSRSMSFYLFMGFLLVWSYVGAYHLKNQLQMQVPIFGIIGVASLVTAFSFYRMRKRFEFIGAGLLSFGFALWGIYLSACPFFAGNNHWVSTGFLISAVLQLFIAVSMIVLVLEEARAANETLLNQIRSTPSELQSIEAKILQIGAQEGGLLDRAAMDEKLRAAYEELRLAQEKNLQEERLQALSQMSRGIAHDINNALTPILGYATLIQRSHPELPESVRNYVMGIKNAGDKIAQSVACIRDFYRREAGKEAKISLELNRIVEEVLEISYTQWLDTQVLSGVHIDVKTDYCAELPNIKGQKSEVREALTQVTLNAIQAMPQGGTLTLKTRIAGNGGERPGSVVGKSVVVEISDTGVGMNAETRKRCLEPFFSTKDKHGAKGLGLSKVFGVIQRHTGQIVIESELGKGTVIRLSFPAAEAATATGEVSVPEAVVMAPLRILCVDDEAPVLDVLRIILQSAGHTVEGASNGFGALEAFRSAKARNESFDVVLTDLGMPKMDGRQVAKLIKEESHGTPVIMLTGWGDIMKVEGNHPDQIDVVLSKPPQVNELFLALRKLTANLPKAQGLN
ncbi:response regulator [Pedosphaera parvula]|uniref:histidine kinase n=1 Tax=Pedosphaera parvula (strain Ellin514) TaxID=320771 RepID=B9XJW6_PEDPL|nr:response regulator [Pedosphaera parvula]EEF59789.1 integral membrane sensor hybrid histidine kinase [Pedosphaera parvula Ellin514]